MKTTGVSDIPKFGLLDFLGHPTVEVLTLFKVARQNTWKHSWMEISVTWGPENSSTRCFLPLKASELHSIFFVGCFSWLCDLGWVPECGWMEEGLSDRAGDSGKSPPPSSHHQHSQASKAVRTMQYHLWVFKRILLCRRQKLPTRCSTASPRHPHTHNAIFVDAIFTWRKREI